MPHSALAVARRTGLQRLDQDRLAGAAVPAVAEEPVGGQVGEQLGIGQPAPHARRVAGGRAAVAGCGVHGAEHGDDRVRVIGRGPCGSRCPARASPPDPALAGLGARGSCGSAPSSAPSDAARHLGAVVAARELPAERPVDLRRRRVERRQHVALPGHLGQQRRSSSPGRRRGPCASGATLTPPTPAIGTGRPCQYCRMSWYRAVPISWAPSQTPNCLPVRDAIGQLAR